MTALTPPPRLYKYFSFTAQNLENLKNQSIYFNSPKNFNDPYDCNVTPRIKIPSNKDVESIRQQILNDPETTEARVISFFNKAPVEILREMFTSAATRVATESIEIFEGSKGVACFSEGCEDLLMWAHYGGNYKGFCLEFDTAYFFPFHKVKYSDLMPEFDPVPILKKELDPDIAMSMFSTKSLSWSYEKEWRLFHEKANTVFGYPSKALTGIYFGPEISRAALEIICLILKGQNETVRFWKGVRDPTIYKVDFTDMDYFSYLQSQKRSYGVSHVPVSFNL